MHRMYLSKTKIYLIMAIFCILFPLIPSFAKKIESKELPDAIQKQIQTDYPDATIEGIWLKKNDRNQSIYQIDLRDGSSERFLILNDNGKTLVDIKINHFDTNGSKSKKKKISISIPNGAIKDISKIIEELSSEIGEFGEEIRDEVLRHITIDKESEIDDGTSKKKDIRIKISDSDIDVDSPTKSNQRKKITKNLRKKKELIIDNGTQIIISDDLKEDEMGDLDIDIKIEGLDEDDAPTVEKKKVIILKKRTSENDNGDIGSEYQPKKKDK